MTIKQKELYESPTSAVVEVKMQGMLCESVQTVFWFLDSSTLSSGEETFGRDGYGDATVW